MSGQLVCEVIAAAPQLRAMGLSPNGFHALIAIAEKCGHVTRQGSVPRSWIQAAIYGSDSTRTAERAVRELRDAKLIDVVKRGYKAPTGEARASVYQLMELPPPIVADADVAPATHGWRELAAAKSGEAAAKSGQAAATQSGGLNGLLNGLPNGDARTRARTDASGNGLAHPTTPKEKSSLRDAPDGAGLDEEALPDWAIPPDPCPKGGNCEKACRHCGANREWNTQEAKAKRQEANYRRAHTEWKKLMGEVRAGQYGDWWPVKPPLNRSDFDPDVPWTQPIPPPALSVDGYDHW